MKKTRICWIVAITIVLSSMFVGCGQDGNPKVVIGGSGTGLAPITMEQSQEDRRELSREELYLFLGYSEASQTIRFIKLEESQREVQLDYYGGTTITNRFGESKDWSYVKPGMVFTLDCSEDGTSLLGMTQSDKVWVFEDVVQYVLNKEENMITIGNQNYYIEEMIPVFDGTDQVSREQMTENDVLTLMGYGNTILSVQISTAHGELAFKNTKGLENGYFVLGNVAAAPIQKGVSLSVRAGEFLLRVAGGGHAGSKQITIKPGKKTTVDLSKFVSMETRVSKVSFVPGQEDTRIFINGEEIDFSEPVELAYGAYRLEVTAPGYVGWIRTLFINSENPKIPIILSKGSESTSSETSTGSTTANQGTSGGTAGSYAGSMIGTGGSTTGNTGQNGITESDTSGSTGTNSSSTGQNQISESLINEVMNIITGN